jgi:hypothetical protein
MRQLSEFGYRILVPEDARDALTTPCSPMWCTAFRGGEAELELGDALLSESHRKGGCVCDMGLSEFIAV